VSQLIADILSRTGASILGLLLLLATTLSLLRTVVVPRSLRSLISDAVARVVTGIAFAFAHLARTYQRRDAILAWAGPVIILGQLVTWLVLFLFGYGLLIYGVSGQDLGDSLREAGSSLFTLGFASVNDSSQTIIDFFAAATGPIVIALMIGFLPTIYSAYIAREVDVTMVGTLSGEPAWGPELLSRITMAGNLEGIGDVFARWTEVASRVRMTHMTYPVLIWVRSGRARRHYAVSLLAVLDAAALLVSLKPSLRHSGAFALLAQGAQTMQSLELGSIQRHRWRRILPFQGKVATAPPEIQRLETNLPGWNRRVVAVEVASDLDAIQGKDSDAVATLSEGLKHPLELTRADFDEAVALLVKSGFPIDADVNRDDSWDRFRVARSRYEFAAYALCRRLDAPRAPWTGDRSLPTPVMWPNLASSVLPDVEAGEHPETDEAPGQPPADDTPSAT
jgi:hypothetical protein